jgi:very-short-patch-repair endonuclease
MNKKEKLKVKFLEKVIKKHGNKYDYSLVMYEKSRIKIKIICTKHGIFEQEPANHIRGQGCPKCSGSKKHTKEEFINKANEIHKNKYDYSLVEYKNNKSKIKIICPEHGEFEARPDNHINKKSGCSKCANNILYTTEDFIFRANIKHNNKYNYNKVDYKTAHKKIIITCSEHGDFIQKPSRHLSGDGCSKCSGKYHYTNDEFIEKSNQIHNNKYDYSLTNYKRNQTKIKIICPIHGEFYQKPYSHLQGFGCENCKTSRGEKEIRDFLMSKNIKFKQNKRFNKCKDKKTLPFDFYLSQDKICIEYDGIQHFEPVEYWGGQSALETQQLRDQIKTNYCLQNNITLIRIKYNENILEKLNQNF